MNYFSVPKMFFKYLIFLLFNIFILFSKRNCENFDEDMVHLHLFGQIENIKRSLEIVNSRLDMLSDRTTFEKETIEKPQKLSTSIFDIRLDSLPKDCIAITQPSTCAEATKCTRTSGIYNITDYRFSNKTFTVYCDYDSYEGDWLYILTRNDGTENFNRPWTDYVQGFGNVAGEFWLGLDKLYALTNYYGPQELNVHIENFDGTAKFARYDNFVIGNVTERYKLKSLGRYSGAAGDSLSRQLGRAFTTYDIDAKLWPTECAKYRKGGYWYADCSDANPTGQYLRANYTSDYNGCFWTAPGKLLYSVKTFIFMIRRKKDIKLEQ
ncbi:microfibril-associated glycoprotein 4-like [Lucilia sericata]|uniref:microfibril-associated glycoprotein 4-like n=1 Tax=Lucilia sericata TaxID=13632 RepID=UPI0018A86532|nr:microfibril-associated glycoprotein 4-like [Lucilia sericata]